MYLGKMIEVTREAPANLGTAMKTIIARFEDMKKDPNALIDGASANKVEAALATIGIALRDTAGEFRPLQDVFDELGMAWQSLTRNQQAYIATVAAGSRQQSRFLAMMNNYDRTLELIRESQDSSGAAFRQYETYQDSAAAATARLTAAWEEFYSKVVSSERITNTINLLTNLVETMSKIGPTWSAIIATISAHSINKAIKSNLGGKILESFTSATVKSIDNEDVTFTIANTFWTGVKEGLQKTRKGIAESGIKKTIEEQIGEGTKEGIKKGLLNSASLGNIIGSSIGPVLAGILASVILIGITTAVAKAITFAEEKEQRWLKKDSEEIKKDREKVDEYKKERRIIEDNYEIYKKYNKQIVLTEDELKEQNQAVENIQEQYKNLIVVIDDLGRKNILNTEELEKHTKNLKDQTLELEKQNALKKYGATNPSPAQIRKYGDSDEYMKDWTVTQLTNVGYTEQEAQILELYGEMKRNPNNNKAGFGFNNTPGSFSLYDRINSDLMGIGYKDNNLDRYVETITKGSYDEISKLLDELRNREKNTPEVFEELKKYYQVVEYYAENAIKALDILNSRSGEYAKTLLNLNLENINNSTLQNDLFNFFSNLSNFNNGAFLEQFTKENLPEGKTIEEYVDEINEKIANYVNNLSPVNKKSFHELSKKLLDPTLSTQDKEIAVKKFEDIAGDLSDEMQAIVDQFVAGSNTDIKRREMLNNELGIVDPKFLQQFNSAQLQIIDQLRTANKNTGFNIYKQLLNTEDGTQLIKALSTLQQDILNDPSVYGIAQETMVDFFKRNFKLESKEAYDTFYEMFGDIPEIAVEAASDAFSNTKDLVLTDPTKALTKKQTEAYQELESLLGESLEYYILINEEGEEYLSIAGRIAIFEKAAQNYENAILAEISAKEVKQRQLVDIHGKITKENQKEYNLLQKQIDLDKQKLEILQETKQYTAQTTAALNNIDYATGYNKNIKAIREAQKEMQRANGVLDQDTAKTLISMGNGYIKYLNEKMIGEDKYYTLTKENADLMMADQRKIYNDWIEEQKGKLQNHINILTAELEYFQSVVDAEGDLSKISTQEEFNNKVNTLDDKLQAAETELEGEANLEKNKNEEILNEADKSAEDFYNIWHASYSALRAEWNQLAKAMGAGKPTIGETPTLQKPNRTSNNNIPTDLSSPEKPSETIKPEDKIQESQTEKNKRLAQEQVDRLKTALERLTAARDELEVLGPDFEDVSKGAGKTADEMKKLTKVLEDCAKSLEKLDDLLKELKFSLNNIKPDYNPFTELFEAWEKEWDYYYNIKRLIAELGQQGQFIDNIVSADFASADQKVAGYHAKIGNLIAQMSANDTYITSLRTGMSQTAIELMKEYGEYYKINPDTGQIYQTDKSLNEINTTINAAKQELYQLSKIQNERQNDLNLENSKLEALEQEKSAYESILSEVESQIDSYKNLDDVITDTSELEANRSAIKAKIEISDESIEAQKEKIRNMEDEIQNLEIQIELKGNIESDLEDYVEKMGDKVQEYEEYWETLNSTIAEQQEILSQLNDVFSYYVDTAISTEQEIYNAIIENYQDEINKKKEQYDYLKQLDKDYLASVKDNINQERKAREESNKQKNYQQSLQRMQLLQQDTSGAYRNEIAQLGKEIEDKRQELYDDLVDKQVEALEKEVEKRHELYDKEVAALEERLAYMQENAILLWEMVNNIVAEGAESMMAELENTTAYINSNELSRQKQRKQWEQNIKITYDGVTNNQIDNIKAMVEKGKDYINSLQEIKSSMEVNIETYKTSTQILIEENEQFQNAMNTFMIEWNRITNRFTGYYESWEQTVSVLKAALDNNIQALIAMNNEGGSIKELDRSLRNSAKDMYDDFIAERQRYRNELEGLIQQIKSEISAAIQTAADAIRKAAENLQVTPNRDSSTNETWNPVATNLDSEPAKVTPTNPTGGKTRYKIQINGGYLDKDGKVHTLNETYGGYNSAAEAIEAVRKDLARRRELQKWQNYWHNDLIPIAYAKGGLANFTGPAWLDGTSSNPERVLSPRQTKLFESMVHSLEKSTNSNINSGLGSSYNIGDINTTIQVDKLDNEADVNKLVKQVEDKILKTIRNRVVVSV